MHDVSQGESRPDAFAGFAADNALVCSGRRQQRIIVSCICPCQYQRPRAAKSTYNNVSMRLSRQKSWKSRTRGTYRRPSLVHQTVLKNRDKELPAVQSAPQGDQDALPFSITTSAAHPPQALFVQRPVHGQDREARRFSTQKPRLDELHASAAPARRRPYGHADIPAR